jgi:chromosome segregation ATPase
VNEQEQQRVREIRARFEDRRYRGGQSGDYPGIYDGALWLCERIEQQAKRITELEADRDEAAQRMWAAIHDAVNLVAERDEAQARADGLQAALDRTEMAAQQRDAAQARADALQAALEPIEAHLAELADAWERGALSEHDGKGGLRSNRNHDLWFSLRKLLATGHEQEGEG